MILLEMNNYLEKFKKLNSFLKSKSVVVAFSGGLDSTVLLNVALESAKKVMAVFVQTPFISKREKIEAREYLKENKIPNRILKVNVLAYPRIKANSKKRCYHCKKAIFSTIKSSFRDEDYDLIIEGSNSSDLGDYRPGLEALKELGVESPYIKFGITKDEIRQYARMLGLAVAEKYSNSCLATRIPYGEEITAERLERIDSAEELIRSMLNVKQLRVRDHGNIARIEVLKEDFHLFLSNEKKFELIQKLKKLGYNFVTLDLEGYKTGSMNVFLEKKQDEGSNN